MTTEHYDNIIKKCKAIVVERKNSYGDSINMMRVSSITDLIMMKLYRTRNNMGISKEKVIDEFRDSINYLVFALGMLEE